MRRSRGTKSSSPSITLSVCVGEGGEYTTRVPDGIDSCAPAAAAAAAAGSGSKHCPHKA